MRIRISEALHSITGIPKLAPMVIKPDICFLRKHVEELVRYTRNPEHINELNESAEYIRQEFKKLGLQVEEDVFNVDGREFKNLRVSFGPKTGERFIVGSHYDVYGDQPGADDNASGIAGILELARMLKESKIEPKTPLDLIAYTLEEGPYFQLGSGVHADSLKKQGIKVKGMLTLEMIGYFSDKSYSQTYPLKPLKFIFPNKGNFIGLVGYNNSSLPLIIKTQRAIGHHIPVQSLWWPWKLVRDMGRSDHGPYCDLGYPALMVTDTANFRNPHYHSVGDQIDTLDFEKMSNVVKGIYELISKL